jgi:UDP-glucose 4-epimerase
MKAEREQKTERLPYTSIAITGASGYIGLQLVAALAADRHRMGKILAIDVRPPAGRISGVEYAEADVRTADFGALFRSHGTDLVVHLAAIVTPGPATSRELEFAVDVGGTRNILDGCAASSVRKIVYTSSGAAYGYHADSPSVLRETDALRGNPEFAYSNHKRIVEEMLAASRRQHPGLAQLIFRPGTILGSDAHNQITDMFDRSFVVGVRGAATPFVIIWDQDVVGAIVRGIHRGGTGIYNLAGDGTITLAEIAGLLEKPFVALPATVLKRILGVLHRFGLTQYGPEQVNFLRYRPVLDNRRLKQEFGYVPRKSTRETFELFLKSRAHRGMEDRPRVAHA